MFGRDIGNLFFEKKKYARMCAKFVFYFRDKFFSKSWYLQEDCLTLLFLLEGCKITTHVPIFYQLYFIGHVNVI